jgi:hypothetical protein
LWRARFNVYVSQPEVKPGCVLRQSNYNLLEKRELVSPKQVRARGSMLALALPAYMSSKSSPPSTVGATQRMRYPASHSGAGSRSMSMPHCSTGKYNP